MTRRIFTLILALAACSAMAFAATKSTAAQLLDELRAKVNGRGAVEAVFTLRADKSASTKGSVIMQGGQYSMTTPELKTWYDGKTMWALMTASKEVTLTEPLAEELMMSNPFFVIAANNKFYKVRRAQAGSKDALLFTPTRPKTGIKTVTVILGANGWPSDIKAAFDDGKTLNMHIDNITTTAAKPASAFRFDSKRNPGIEVVDLR